ncbi:hypothetical protein CDEF62S_02647 [Castellaniella defragrans]
MRSGASPAAPGNGGGDAARDTSGEIALDVHVHLVPVQPLSGEVCAGVSWREGRLVVDGKPLGVSGLFHPEQLLAWMDAQRIKVAWVSIPPPVYRQELPEAASREWHRRLDQGMRTVVEGYPGRLACLRHLPLEHPGLALEIATAALDEGQRRFSVAAGGHPEIVYSSALLEPLWKVLDASGAFLFLHPGHGCDARLDAFYLHNLLGNPYETAVAASHLVLSGVRERFPRIQFCLAHGGGLTAMVAGRLQRGLETHRPGMADCPASGPAEGLKGIMVDCITHDPESLTLAAQVFGEHHVVFGSDWPFPMGILQPHEQLSGTSKDLLGRILSKNAVLLLGR